MIYITVPGSQPLVPVTWVEFGDQSDDEAPGRPGAIHSDRSPHAGPVDRGWLGGERRSWCDRHMLLVDRDNRILYELYHTFWNASLGRWEAGSAPSSRSIPTPGGRYLDERRRRRPRDPSGLVRYDEAFERLRSSTRSG